MENPIDRVKALDITLFDFIQTQTTDGDRRSLLAVQNSVARKFNEYTYLEIGSHLGGSIQQHLLDNRCKKIYSIDPRPSQQPDDRGPDFVACYENNSSERMLALLRNICDGDVAKIYCFDQDASEVDIKKIESCPEYAFIDGEHTKAAVLSDFDFCDKVVSKHGTIVFHDFFVISPAIFEICRILDQQGRTYLPLKLEDNVFAIFFDPELVHSDSYLEAQFNKNKHFLIFYPLKSMLKRILPERVIMGARVVRRMINGGI